MTSRLTTLTKRVAELHDTGLRECHYVKDFTHWWIHPLGRREKLASECPWLDDPSREPVASKIFNSVYCC
jgi:hypothetical protein